MASLKASELFGVAGQVIVISGGGTGIGAMMAKALAQNGARRVYILGRRLEKLQETAKLGVDGNIVPLQCDVSQKESLQAAAKQVQDDVGFVNVVVANSGVAGPQIKGLKENASVDELQEFLWKHTMEEYQDAFQLNTISPLFTMVAFLRLLDAGNKHSGSPGPSTGIKSQFIVTSSIAGFNRFPTAGFGYGSSKAAVNHMMKQLSLHLAPYHIRVNVICPGLYPSEMTSWAYNDASDITKEGALPLEKVPARRYGTEEDMAGNILYLVGRAGAYLNSNFIISDGGRLTQMPATY